MAQLESLLALLQKLKHQLIPYIRDPRQAPMDAVRIGSRILRFLVSHRLPKLTINRGMPVFSVLRELSDVENRHLWAHPVQHLLHHSHRGQVRPTSPVIFLLYRLCLVVTVAFTSGLPLVLPVWFNRVFEILLQLWKSEKWSRNELMSRVLFLSRLMSGF